MSAQTTVGRPVVGGGAAGPGGGVATGFAGAGSASLDAGSGSIVAREPLVSSSIVVLGGLPHVPSSNCTFSAAGTHRNVQPGTVSPSSPLMLIFTR